MKMQVTVQWEYETQVGNYDDETNPEVWAQVDRNNMLEDPGIVSESLQYYPYTVKVEPA